MSPGFLGKVACAVTAWSAPKGGRVHAIPVALPSSASLCVTAPGRSLRSQYHSMLDHSPKVHAYSLGDGKTKGILTKGSFIRIFEPPDAVKLTVSTKVASTAPFP